MINRAGQLPFKFRKQAEPGYYQVHLHGVKLGVVYRDDDAWSWGRWFIEGEPQKMTDGGVDGRDRKARGYGTRYLAARRLAMAKSALLTRAQAEE